MYLTVFNIFNFNPCINKLINLYNIYILISVKVRKTVNFPIITRKSKYYGSSNDNSIKSLKSSRKLYILMSNIITALLKVLHNFLNVPRETFVL